MRPLCSLHNINKSPNVGATPLLDNTVTSIFSYFFFKWWIFEWQSYLNPFVLGAYDSPGPGTGPGPTGPGPGGWDVEVAGLQGPPQDMFPTDRGLLG